MRVNSATVRGCPNDDFRAYGICVTVYLILFCPKAQQLSSEAPMDARMGGWKDGSVIAWMDEWLW